MKAEPWVAGAVWCARALLIALLFTHPILSWGSVSYVASSASALSSSPVSSITITAPVGLATGDVLIAMVGQSNSVLPIVKTVPAGWTLILEQDDGSSSGVSVYSRIATSSDVAGTTTYAWTFKGPARSGGEMLDFRGVLSTSPVIASASTVNGTSNDYTAPSITPGIPNTELVVLLAANDGSGGMNVPTAMTSAFVGATGAGPNGFIIGAFTEALAASTATGTLQSTANNSAGSIGISLALQSAAGAAPDHFSISDLSTAVNCQASPVTITAHSASHAAVSTTSTITVSTSTAHGDWSLAAGGGSGSFTPGAANGGTATYTYVTADGGAVMLLLKDTYVETVTINVAAGSVTQKSGNANSSEQPPLTFVASGFRITNGSNVAATIATQIAAKSSTQTLALQAVRTDNNGACAAAFASGATVNVSLAYQCNNPTSCVALQSFGITNNSITTNIASNANGSVSTYTTVPLKFSTANAEAPFSFSYSDVGQVTLYALYFIPLGSGSPSANSMTGSSQFVVQPSNFSLTNIKCTTFGAGTCSTLLSAPGNNPGATSAAGTAFIQAGQAFSTTVTARNFAGAATPNYGQEIAPPGVTLSANLILPVGGNAPTLNNASAFGSFSAGVATGTTFNWPEVGIITLTPAVASYLGSGAVTGTASGDVGRFIPNAFSTAPNTPLFGTGCPNAVAPFGFSYLGQPLTYTVPPVLTVTALSAVGSTARNYTGAFLKMTNSTLTGRTYTPTPVSPALDSSGLPSTAADPAITDLGSGQAALTFGAGTGLLFTRGAAVAPFSANIALSINVIDSDGAAAPNPVSFGSAGGIGFSTSAVQYYGRLALRDAVGSELLDLPMALTTQYYLSTTQGFTTNTIDNCTTLATPSIAFSKFLVNLTSAQACVRDSGKPGLSGAGCAVAAPVATAFKATASSGNFNLVFAAPGSGFNGAMTATGTAPAWLQYAWTVGANTNPTGIAAFGVFSGQTSRVYQREVY
jgi:MSHA biogenesis protein MshQ